MRIGIDASSIEGESTGVGRYLLNLLNELAVLDRKNEYFLFFKSSAIPEGLTAQANFKRIIVRPLVNSGFIWRNHYLHRAAYKVKPDIFHFPFYMMPVFFKIPSITTIHDISYEVNPSWFTFWAGLLFRTFSRYAARVSKVILTDSLYSAEELERVYKLGPEKVRVIPLAAEGVFKTAKADAKINIRFNITSPFILYAGTITKRRNLEKLFSAFNILVNEKKTALQLVLAGGTVQPAPELMLLEKKYKLEGKVIKTGYVTDEELAGLYRAAACFVYPSLYEGFGLPVLEAFASGCPAITSGFTATAETAGGAAILIDPLDEVRMAEAINNILTDTSLRDALVEKGFARAAEFSWARTASLTLGAYKDLFEGKIIERKSGAKIRSAPAAGKIIAVITDEKDLLVTKMESNSYPAFFVFSDTATKDKIKLLVEKKKLMEPLEKRAAIVFSKLFLEDSVDLIFLGQMYYLTGDKKYFEFYAKGFTGYLFEKRDNADILNMLIAYGYFKDAGVNIDLKKKFLLILSEYVKEKKAQKTTVIEKTVLHAIAVFMPFLFKAPEGDLFLWLAGRIDRDGIVSLKKPKENLELLEALAVNISLTRLNRKVDTSLYKISVEDLFSFVFKFAGPDKKYDSRFRTLSGRTPDVEYVKYLKSLYDEDWDSACENLHILDYVFMGGAFQLEAKDLKPSPYEPDLSSSGYPRNKFYLLKSANSRLATDIFTFTFTKNSEDILLPPSLPSKFFTLDDGLIVYDKNLETNLWVAGREYDFLDADYDIIPSVRHRIQYFLHKKTNHLIIRHKFSGSEQHTVKINFYTKEKNNNAPMLEFDKQTIRDTINKFTRANKTETAFLKLNGDQTVGASLNGGKTHILPLLNPGLKVEINHDCVSYSATLLLPNELIFMVY
ncbi:MAG: glycosyltransferase family 1 protein [Candidatus Firestonebacteria bacterium]|nr:glycosyltransferase family 1 protein [Candidatus Firestonebacteria bacterium]